VTEAVYTAPAVSDALGLNPTVPNTIAATYIANLETNNLSVKSSKAGGGYVEMLKEDALGLRVNDGSSNVLRAYVDADTNFSKGDVVIGNLTSPTDTNNKGIVWNNTAKQLDVRGKFRGYLDNMELSPPPAGTPQYTLWSAPQSTLSSDAYQYLKVEYPINCPFTGRVDITIVGQHTVGSRLYWDLDGSSGSHLSSAGDIYMSITRTVNVTPSTSKILALWLSGTAPIVARILAVDASVNIQYGAIGHMCVAIPHYING
jgi:hypothetical protein